ncbi:MAG: LysR family transcriptional regulator [Eggerthellaceae bacterium]|nr:LysR family transcriptional regulator [Eggerthellaceae bacterium]
MEIKQLRHMQSAARYSSYARAATECFTSRQNIAHSVKTLEAELGVSLFERKRSGVVLTPAGKVVARHVDEIISSVDNLRYLFVDAGDLNRTLNLAISTNLFAGIPHVVDEYFMEWGNKLRFVEMDPERCYQAVLSGMVDAAIVSCMKREFPGCSSYQVMDSPAFIVTDESSPLAAEDFVSLSDLADQRLLLQSMPTFQYEPLFAQLEQLGFNRGDVNVITSTGSMVHMVRRHGGGICGIVSAKFATNPPAGTTVVRLADSQLKWHFYILYRLSAESSSIVMKLAQGVRAAFKAENFDMNSLLIPGDGQ